MTTTLSAELLRSLPLPQPGSNADKEQRGRVLIVAGSHEVPGAGLLSGIAALRSGAGKLQLAVPKSIAVPIGIALPEAGVVALSQTKSGVVSRRVVKELYASAARVDAVLVGPGLMDDRACKALTLSLLENVENAFVLDAGALSGLRSKPDSVLRQRGRVVLTPHAGEMAAMLDIDKKDVESHPQACAVRVAECLGCVVALKGADTYIATEDGKTWKNACGAVGLGTSGSGDVLAGIIAGFMARGASALKATLWGVYVHAQAGESLSRSVAPLGFLARDILAEIPLALAKVEG